MSQPQTSLELPQGILTQHAMLVAWGLFAGLNALVFVQIEGRHAQFLFADTEGFFHSILVPIELEHLLIGKAPLVGHQQIATIQTFGLGQGGLISLPMEQDMPRHFPHLDVIELAYGRTVQAGLGAAGDDARRA